MVVSLAFIGTPASLSGVQESFDYDTGLIETRFNNKITKYVDDLCKRVLSVPVEPSTSTDVFDIVISAFSVGIGDEKTGIYGDFVADLNNVVELCSQAITRYVDHVSMTISTQQQADSLQSQATSVSSHIGEVIAALNNRVSSAFSAANTKFTNCLSTAQNKSAHYYIIAITDSYIGAINRADKRAVDSINELVGLYKQYKTIPGGFYNDLSTILTNISTAYNEELSHANDDYNTAITAYKYYSTASSDEIAASQTKIGNAITESNKRVGDILNSIPSDLTNKGDLVFAEATVALGSQLFAETNRIIRDLYKYVKDIAENSEIVMRSVDKYFRGMYSPIFVDGVSYRNSRATVINGASGLVVDAINDNMSRYNDHVSMLNTNYNTFLSQLSQSVIDYINDNVPGLTEDQLDSINNRMSAIISSNNTRLSAYFTYYSNYITYISNGLTSRVNTLAKRYYDMQPLLRFTGHVVTPVHISSVDDNLFSIGIQNVGGSTWIGWVGIRLSGQVDSDSDIAKFTWNNRVGYKFLSPGSSVILDIVVPGGKIYNLSSIGTVATPTILVNTFKGVYKSLL